MASGYFPGCSLEGTAAEFDLSIRAVTRALDLPLTEIEDWNCCGASAAHQTNHLLGLALPARSIALAAKQGLAEIFAPCAACSNRLIAAQAEWTKSEAARKEVEEAIGMPLPAKALPVRNCIDFLLPHLEKIKAAVKKPLAGKKAACYYGCLLVRPPKVVAFDDPENPTSMEKVVAATGAEPVSWAFRTECCGAAFAMSSTKSVARLCERILTNAQAEGAQMLIVACPLCHANLDMRQPKGMAMPVLYLTQLVGIAAGLDAKQLGLEKHMTPVAAAVA
jgi:heterodisulfide reductase subunit B2